MQTSLWSHCAPVDHRHQNHNSHSSLLIKRHSISQRTFTTPLFRSDNPLFRSDDPLFRSHNPFFRSDNPLFRSDDPLFRSNNPLFRSHNPAFRVRQPRFSGQTTRFSGRITPLSLPLFRPDSRAYLVGQCLIKQFMYRCHITCHVSQVGLTLYFYPEAYGTKFLSQFYVAICMYDVLYPNTLCVVCSVI